MINENLSTVLLNHLPQQACITSFCHFFGYITTLTPLILEFNATFSQLHHVLYTTQ